jgi:hypothetical protein
MALCAAHNSARVTQSIDIIVTRALLFVQQMLNALPDYQRANACGVAKHLVERDAAEVWPVLSRIVSRYIDVARGSQLGSVQQPHPSLVLFLCWIRAEGSESGRGFKFLYAGGLVGHQPGLADDTQKSAHLIWPYLSSGEVTLSREGQQ